MQADRAAGRQTGMALLMAAGGWLLPAPCRQGRNGRDGGRVGGMDGWIW